MIYPPINNLVEKLGSQCSRYDLVIAAAKRAREIANEERMAAKEKQPELSSFEMHRKERMESKNAKKYMKPITRALDEIVNDDIYITHDAEEAFTSSVEDVVVIEVESRELDFNYDDEDDEIEE